MNILGIETSCDETSAAVVHDGRTILSNVVVTSLKEHAKYGGVIPEIASRRQLEFINAVTSEALAKAKVSLKDIDAIAVTVAPGLIGSLLVGISFARALSFALGKPLIEVDHIKAHLYANFLNFSNAQPRKLPILPAVGLIVSGGHSSLYYIKSFKDFRLLGQTRDDAAGEAFDKVARVLNLGYPGGPVIDRLAKEGTNSKIRFACAKMPESFDFSFSGVKTAVLYYKNKEEKSGNALHLPQIAFSFQKSVVDILVDKSLAACHHSNSKTLLIGGGVAANSFLRQSLNILSSEHNIDVFVPDFSLCLDNAAMIAGLAYHLRRS